MNPRQLKVSQREENVRLTIDKLLTHPSLSRDISNMDTLAKTISQKTGIGYSTLLKKNSNYRRYLESALFQITTKDSKLVSFSKNMPNNWIHQKAIYESEISLLKGKINHLQTTFEHTRIALGSSSNNAGSVESAVRERELNIKIEKLCRALAIILDYCAEELMGIELNSQTKTIECYGEVLMKPELLEPYIEWQNKLLPLTN